MPQDNAAPSAGENSATVVQPAEQTASTAATPETPTETTSNVSLLDRLGIPAETQAELSKLNAVNAEPEAEPVTQAEPTATAEEPETTEADVEETDAEVQPDKNGFIPKDVFEKRTAKLTKQKHKAIERAEKAEEEAERLRAQLENTQPVTVMPTDNDLLADVQNEQQLAERVKIAKAGRDVYRARLNGFTINEGTDNERFISPEEVAATLGRFEDVINEHAPKKADQLRQRTQYERVAKEKYPALFDRGTEDYQLASGILQRFPWLANDPAKDMVIGDYLRGARARIEAENKTAAAQSKDVPEALLRPHPPIAPPVPTASRSNGSQPSQKNVDKAMNRVVEEGGSPESLLAAIRARREAREKAGNREAALA